jgi:DNA (cytosine-5)-methyltransferase 1
MATSKKSTGKKLKNPTSSVGVTHVSLSVRQVSGEVKKIRGICGHGSEQPLANYDPDTQSWKMYGDISLWGDCPLLVNLPVSGMTQSGVLFLQHPWEPITSETELSSWPTPTARDHKGAAGWKNPNRNLADLTYLAQIKDGHRMWPTPTTNDSKTGPGKANPNLIDAVLMRPLIGEQPPTTKEFRKSRETWPTPVASDAWTGDLKSTQQTEGSRHSLNLSTAVQNWPTPTYGKLAGGTGGFNQIEELYLTGQVTLEEKKAMQAGNGGRLNPTWVEWLMGFPTGWTDLEDWETL